jgi:hypothetical protein
MPERNRLIFASIFFGVAWALGMIWWSGPSTVNVIILTIAGVIAGVLWYYAMKWYFRFLAKWQAGRRGSSSS